MRKKFVVLDSWRGICALLVAAYHMTINSHVFYSPFLRHAWLFVDFFFVLSGFVITHAYGDRLRDGREFAIFAIRRFGRLWPLHIAVLAVFVVLEVAKLGLLSGGGLTAERVPFTGIKSIGLLVLNIFLLQATPLAHTMSWNGPSWSISAEWWTISPSPPSSCCSGGAGFRCCCSPAWRWPVS